MQAQQQSELLVSDSEAASVSRPWARAAIEALACYADGVAEARAAVESILSRAGVFPEVGGDDSPTAVWEAAFQGMVAMGNELEAIEAGLLSPVEDLKGRALALLALRLQACVREASAPGAPACEFEPEAMELLERALADRREQVRSAALKMALELGGSDPQRVLRVVARSPYADVRRQVLSELAAKAQEPWAWQLLLQMLDDPDARLRTEAFAMAGARAGGAGVQHLAWSMTGPHEGLKLLAIEALRERRGRAVRALIAGALQGGDGRVQDAAIEALVDAEAEELLVGALHSPDTLLRARVGLALARTGHEAASAPMLALLSGPGPEPAETEAHRTLRLCLALEALSELGTPAAQPLAAPCLSDPNEGVRRAATACLAAVSDPAQPAQAQTLRRSLGSQDPEEAAYAALGLALLGEPWDAEAVGRLAGQPSCADLVLAAATACAGSPREPLTDLCVHEVLHLRRGAVLLCLLREAARAASVPRWLGTLVETDDPVVRLVGVEALGAYPDRDGLLRGALKPLRGCEGKLGCLSATTTQGLAALLAWGSPPMRARAARLVLHASRCAGTSRCRLWPRFASRFAAQLQEAARQAEHQRHVEIREARALISGMAPARAVGLLPLASGRSDRDAMQLVRTARTITAIEACLRPLLVAASRDPDAEVRRAAARALLSLGVDATQLGSGDLQERRAVPRILAQAAARPARSSRPADPATPSDLEPQGDVPAAHPMLVKVGPSATVVPAAPGATRELLARQGSFLLLPSPPDFLWLRRHASDGNADQRAVRLSGQIATRTGICDIVAFVGQSCWRGELMVLSDTGARSIFFANGNVVGAHTNVESERIGQIMYRYGALDAGQLEQVEQQARQGVRFGWAAVQLGFITQEKLLGLIGEQIKLILYGTFAIDKGTFFFLDDFYEDRLMTGHTYSANGLLLDGLSQLDEMELFRRRIPSLQHIPARTGSAVPVPEECVAIYGALDGHASLEELTRRTGLGEYATYKQVYGLLMSKHALLLPPRIPGGARALIDAANQALRVIHQRVDQVGRGEALRSSVARLSLRAAVASVVRDAGPDGLGALDPDALLSNCQHASDPSAAERVLQAALHDYVASALFSAEGELGPAAAQELSQGVRRMLTVLRPRGDTLPPSGPGGAAD
jgi:HEAT repeat protein